MARTKRYLLLAMALSIGVWLLSPHFNRYYLGVAIDVGIAIIMAVSLNLINGHTGQFSLGHAGFMAVGGYTAAKLSLMFEPHLTPALVPVFFAGALVAGGLMAALAGLAVGVPSLRLKGDYLAIVTLGFGEIIRVLFQTSEFMGGATGLNGIPRHTNFAWAFVLAAVTVYVVACLVNSTYGRGFLAVHDDEIAAGAMGINPTKYKVIAFVIGAFFAGIAGGLYAHHKLVMKPEGFDFMRSIEFVVMVILGGMGRTAGVIFAAVVLTVLPEFLRGFAEYRMIIYSLVIILMMLLRPQGLFGGLKLRRKAANS